MLLRAFKFRTTEMHLLTAFVVTMRTEGANTNKTAHIIPMTIQQHKTTGFFFARHKAIGHL